MENVATCELAHGDALGACSWCGEPLPDGRWRFCSDDCSTSYSENHVYERARLAKLRDSGYTCASCGLTDWDAPLEVHHDATAPVRGRLRYAHGCWNHQDRLTVLCRGCHANETRIERRERSRYPDRPLQLRLPVPA